MGGEGWFVSKFGLFCVLLANVFCGVLWCFAGVLWCFAGVLRCFASVLQYFHKTHKTPKKHRKIQKNTKKLTIRSCIAGVFKEQKNSTVLHKTPFTKHLQNTAKHRKTQQNSHKTRFVKLRRKTPQNKRKTLKKVTKPSHYSRNTYCVLRAFGVFFKNTLDLSQKYTMRNTRKLRITGGVTCPRRGSRFFKKQCFAVFCGVLRCFAVFCVRVF